MILSKNSLGCFFDPQAGQKKTNSTAILLSGFSQPRPTSFICVNSPWQSGHFLLSIIPLPSFDLSWNTIDGGGGSSQAGQYSLTGAIGQPDAGVLSSSPYVLQDGFRGGAAPLFWIHLPMVVK